MAASATAAWPFQALRERCRAETFALACSEVSARPNRLEAGFYASEGYRAVNAMEHSGFEMVTVADIAEVRWFGPFARKYVSHPSHGRPFLTSSSMMEARIQAPKLVSKKHTRHLDRLVVREGYVLISCSGTIGNVVVCTKDVDGWACSQDAIRVIANDTDELGPISCFLQSPPGQFLLKRSQSGSVITHIYDHDVAALPIPRLPRRLRQELTRLVKKASALRVEANRLLDEAEEQVYVQNGINRQPTGEDMLAIFRTPFQAIESCLADEGCLRLDAPFYSPEGLGVRAAIRRCSSWGFLGDLSGGIVLIGKTFVPGVNKVDLGFGRPYFTGKELFPARIKADAFVASRHESDIERLIVTPQTTLVTCAGTVGRVTYVSRQLANTAVTHDAIRVLPSRSLAGGYIYAFLSSRLGQAQLGRCRYGSVIPRLHSSQVCRVMIAVPKGRGHDIGSIVDSAFRSRDQAADTEDKALGAFEKAVTTGRRAIEDEWGSEY
jgi:type I restriction enzyme, S subunit